MYLLALGATSLATYFDLRSRRIPNVLTGGLFVWALAATCAGFHPLGWRQATLGSLVAAVLTLPAFSRGWFGGGDTKLAVALGLTLGLVPFLIFFAATAVFGGVLALRAPRANQTEIAYAPAMLLGLLTLLPFRWLA